ncbi:GNAT family N-acetyltransferase [Thermoleophilia bacterium SCSIO 60948]|nr:GNAT family N-acetyltransferase [Thermoleophilia bacterium SCSIO 60948]
MRAEAVAAPAIRRESIDGDVERIGDLHRRLYLEEYGLGESFVDDVEIAARRAFERGWPTEREGAWLVEPADGAGAHLLGAAALLDEAGGAVGTVRWVCLDPRLRGHGLGRRLIGEAVASARSHGYERLELGTFSDLTAAAAIYRSLGFRVTREETGHRWGRTLTYQRYELDLSSPPPS